MSHEDVGRFLDLISSESSIEDALNTAAERQEDVAATAVKLGAKHGLHFSRDEFSGAIEAFHRAHPGELDDAELEGVSGGFNPQPEPPPVGYGATQNPWFSQPWSKKLNWGP
jgi:hypothetical protein